MNTKKIAPIFALIVSAILIATLASCSSSSKPAEPENAATTVSQTTFSSPEQASQAVVDALRAGDEDRLKLILGEGADEVLSSGDNVADNTNRQKFLDLYDAKHSLTPEKDGSVTVLVGDDNWPMPIPIVKNDSGQWYFDTPAGLDELLNRRIGKNELSAIQVCLAVVDAEHDYVQRNPDGDNMPEYAQKIVSDPGKKNGLYWPATGDEQASPLGPLMADASAEGYPSATATRPAGQNPYHGYFYHILKSQGPDAPGGAVDYIVNGKMIGGFALIAYPAQYGNSGIMTFIVGYDGVVYQKDLGQDTESLAKSITAFNPDSTWKKT